MFQGLVTVEQVFLSYNRINTIEANTFANLKRLRTLYLERNDLEILTPGTFFGLDSLETLVLVNNHFKSLSADVFKDLPRPLTLAVTKWIGYDDFVDNPLHCDSEVCWLKQEELRGSVRWLDAEPVCADGIDWKTWSCNETGFCSLNFIHVVNLTC